MVRQKTTPVVPIFRVGGGESLVKWGGDEAGRTLSPWGVSPNIRTEGTRAKKRARRGLGQQGNSSPVSQQHGELAVESIRDSLRNAPGMPRQPAANRIGIRSIGLDRERDDMATPTKGGGSIINSAIEEAHQQDDVAEAVDADWEHLRAACTKSKMSGSCKIYGWSVEDDNGARLYKFRDPRIKLQAIGLWHRYCDVEALFKHTQEPHQKIMEGIAGICILLSSKLFDTKDHALNVLYLHKSLEHQEEGVGFKEPKDLDELEIEFLEFIEYRIERDRLCLVFEESHELLYSIKDYVGASNYGSILWNRLVDSFFIVSCNAWHREQIESVPDPLLASAFVAAAYGLTPNPSTDKVAFPSALIYDLCNNPPLDGRWDCKDLEMVTNLILDMVLEEMPGANYDLAPLTGLG